MKHFEKYIGKSLSKADELSYAANSEITIVIPAFNEPFITKTLLSLLNNKFDRPVFVIIVVNYSVLASNTVKNFNFELYKMLVDWSKINNTSNCSFAALLVPDMPRKHAGAGLARKIGMDTAIDLFRKNKQENGIIVSLDADCEVSDNYLSAIYHQFSNDKKIQIVLLDFVHQKVGLSTKQTKAIINYEMYLHYFVLGCRLAGFPYAYHTIGSCFAVRADAYVKQGGMNKKHAGEDFYFLHKLFPLKTTKRIYNAQVFPSSRISARVPFGTGPALKKILQDKTPYLVYSFEAFNDLKPFYNQLELFYDASASLEEVIPSSLKEFFNIIHFEEKIQEARANSSSAAQFKKRLLRHFDAFQLVKYLNFAHEKEFYEKLPVVQAASKIVAAFGKVPELTEKALLCQIHDLEKTTHPR